MKNTLYILFASILALSLSNCSKTPEKEAPKNQQTEAENYNNIEVTNAQFESNEMELGSITEQSFPSIIKITGMIDVPPQSKEIISSFSGGYVKKSNLLIGDKVKKGQALVTIENPYFVELQQEYLEIVEQLTYLKSEYERQKVLFDEKITSQKNYLKAESEYKRSIAKANGFRKKLQMLNINPTKVEEGKITSVITLYASISGSITQINVSKGVYVSSADAIMEIINTDHIHIELTAFEKDLMRIKEGQKINFKIPEASETIYDADVHLVGTSIDEITRTAKVHGHLQDDEKNNFAIGMFVDAEIETSSSNAIAVPENAIVERGEETVILKLESFENDIYTFKTIEVSVGKKHNGFVEIASENLKPTDKILTNGAYGLIGYETKGHNH
ncbi:MAG: efflux RND transporter periplasmic adaptor subunit [Flavobacteriaceae bacterium]